MFESKWLIVPVAALALLLLSIGVTRDYRLKHEDNNAMHATFAHNHLEAGMAATRLHDALINTKNGRLAFYAHHPPGCGLVLAGVFAITGDDRPMIVRGVAIAATLLTLVALWWLVRREEGAAAGLVAATAIAVLPQAAFYGRMVNHEVLALPAIIVMVDRYFATACGGGWRTATGLAVAATVGALLAWVTFFALAACGVHAVLSIRRPRLYPAAGRALVLLTFLGTSLFAVDVAHIALVRGGDLSDLGGIFSRRLGSGLNYGAIEWTRKMFGFSRRLASLSGTVALVWLAVRVVRGLMRKVQLRPIEEIYSVFLTAGVGYVVMFNWGAWQHHYWQFPLLPAVAIALALAVTALGRGAITGPRRTASRVVLALVVIEVVATSAVGLYARHTTPEDRVIEAVETFRSRRL
ncbi:MAG: glycosyltransferase family 39 protein [Acidobacteriota bacterium]|nr:glycosyltransferase family 39 protein [Acidobacteriota bacterium]